MSPPALERGRAGRNIRDGFDLPPDSPASARSGGYSPSPSTRDPSGSKRPQDLTALGRISRRPPPLAVELPCLTPRSQSSRLVSCSTARPARSAQREPARAAPGMVRPLGRLLLDRGCRLSERPPPSRALLVAGSWQASPRERPRTSYGTANSVCRKPPAQLRESENGREPPRVPRSPRQAGGHSFEPSTAHLPQSPAPARFSVEWRREGDGMLAAAAPGPIHERGPASGLMGESPSDTPKERLARDLDGPSVGVSARRVNQTARLLIPFDCAVSRTIGTIRAMTFFARSAPNSASRKTRSGCRPSRRGCPGRILPFGHRVHCAVQRQHTAQLAVGRRCRCNPVSLRTSPHAAQ